MKSIGSKILLVVILGLFVITAVVSTIGVGMTHEIMHRDADRILSNVSQKEAAGINDSLGDVVKSAKIMKHYAVTEAGSVEQLKDEEIRNKYCEKAKKMFSEVSVNTKGAEGFYLRLNPEYSNGQSGFYCLIEDSGNIKDMPLTDITKYASDDSKNVGWYYDAVNAKEGVWMAPYYFPGHNKELISYVEPIYVDGNLLGVVGFDMDFSFLLEYVKKLTVYENGYAVLLATDGKTAYNDVPEQESKDPHTKATVQLTNGMYLELRSEYKDIQRDIRPMLAKIVIAFVVVLFFAIIYTVIVTYRIVKPLKNLTVAAKEIASGIIDSDVSKIKVNSKDEVGTLSQVLANTYEKIQEYTAYINTLAYRDSLTGIKNSTAYSEVVADINKTICTGNPAFGVIVADINNLKLTNDKYGHDVGNDLIVHTAKIISDTFKNSAVFRIGGDEFAIVLKDKDLENYRALMEQMDEACAKDFITVMDNTIKVSIARGVALFDQSIDRVYEDVFAKADHAMYMHKEEIKTTV